LTGLSPVDGKVYSGCQVIAYYHDKTFSLEEFASALEVVTGIVDCLPQDVVEGLKQMPPKPGS